MRRDFLLLWCAVGGAGIALHLLIQQPHLLLQQIHLLLLANHCLVECFQQFFLKTQLDLQFGDAFVHIIPCVLAGLPGLSRI